MYCKKHVYFINHVPHPTSLLNDTCSPTILEMAFSAKTPLGPRTNSITMSKQGIYPPSNTTDAYLQVQESCWWPYVLSTQPQRGQKRRDYINICGQKLRRMEKRASEQGQSPSPCRRTKIYSFQVPKSRFNYEQHSPALPRDAYNTRTGPALPNISHDIDENLRVSK
jgi:hypothetical protein